MPADPAADLLAAARDCRLLPAADLDALAADPARPTSPPELADWLLARGAVTPFLAARVKANQPLRLAGYVLAADLGPVAGGHEYLARHPSLKEPVVVRAVAVADPPAFAARAQAASTVAHPHLSHLLDAGVTDDGQAFAVVEPFDGHSLADLVTDIGPMPTALACTFARQAADGLAAAHARGLAHGGVRAEVLHVGPLVASARARKPDGTPLRRPAANAVAKLFDLGLAPADGSPAADAAGLGYTLAFLLAGRTLTADELRAARPDLPTDLVAVVADLQAGRATAADAAGRLAGFAAPSPSSEPTIVPADPHPSESGILPGGGRSLAAPVVAPPPAVTEQPVVLAEPSPAEWVATPYDGPSGETKFVLPDGSSSGTRFAAPADERRRPPPGKPLTAEERGKLKRLLWVGVGFWAVAALLLVFFVGQSGCFGGGETPAKKRR